MKELKARRPFLTRIGYVGMGPRYMRLGDAIPILGGASLLLIARPVEGGKFSLMGECYCDGIMDREIGQVRNDNDKMGEAINLI